MDPESIAFQPRDDFWRFQNEMIRVQQTQADLSDRVSRLERKQEDDSRLKNVWGTSSPFPSVLGGTPQQGSTAVCVYHGLTDEQQCHSSSQPRNTSLALTTTRATSLVISSSTLMKNLAA